MPPIIKEMGFYIWLAMFPESQKIHFLLGLGVNPLHVDYEGNTPLHHLIQHAVCRNPDRVIFALYLQNECSSHCRKLKGQTVLHSMCSGDSSHPKRLLDEVDKPMNHLPALENLLHLIARLGCTHKSGFGGPSAKERTIYQVIQVCDGTRLGSVSRGLQATVCCGGFSSVRGHGLMLTSIGYRGRKGKSDILTPYQKKTDQERHEVCRLG